MVSLKGIRIRAVAAGLLTDIAGWLAIPFSVVVIALSSGDPSPEHVGGLWSGVSPTLLGLCGTMFFAGLGGYVAAHLSHPHCVANALAVGVLSLALDVVLAFVVPGVTPIWKQILGTLPTIPAALAGGRLAARPSQ